MSRSYKKHYFNKDSNSRRTPHRLKGKTIAGRTVRREATIPSGKSGYKKLYERYHICDYRFLGFDDEKHLRRVYDNGVKDIGMRYSVHFRRGDRHCADVLIRRWKKKFVNK